MHDRKMFHLPEQFQNTAFFDEESVYLHPTDFFYYDLQYLAGMDDTRPWEASEQFLPKLFKQWKEIQTEIQRTITKPFKMDRQKMMTGICLYIQLLYWLNEKPVHSLHLDEIKKLDIAPVNIEDRLTFILKKPTQYHAYIQLNELFTETEKLFYKHQAIKKAKQKGASKNSG
ncbi:YpoC family protein [Aeribacillus pallidus]